MTETGTAVTATPMWVCESPKPLYEVLGGIWDSAYRDLHLGVHDEARLPLAVVYSGEGGDGSPVEFRAATLRSTEVYARVYSTFLPDEVLWHPTVGLGGPSLYTVKWDESDFPAYVVPHPRVLVRELLTHTTP